MTATKQLTILSLRPTPKYKWEVLWSKSAWTGALRCFIHACLEKTRRCKDKTHFCLLNKSELYTTCIECKWWKSTCSCSAEMKCLESCQKNQKAKIQHEFCPTEEKVNVEYATKIFITFKIKSILGNIFL